MPIDVNCFEHSGLVPKEFGGSVSDEFVGALLVRCSLVQTQICCFSNSRIPDCCSGSYSFPVESFCKWSVIKLDDCNRNFLYGA